MLDELLKYKNFNGEDVEETFSFNISAAEMIKMEVSMKGGMKEFFERIIKADDRGEIVKHFDKILLASVGKRSDDGKLFLKTEAVVNEFQYSGAYEAMFFKLLTDAEYAGYFVEKVFPQDVVEKMRASKPVAVNLPTTPVPAPNLSAAPPVNPEQAALMMQSPEFQEFMRRQQASAQNPLGL